MGRTLKDVIAALPADERRRVKTRAEKIRQEVEGLRALRRVAGKAQAEIAATLKIKQPSVSKIEKQTDMYLSTLRSYVEAAGGQLDLVARFPLRPPVRIERLGDVTAAKDVQAGKASARPRAGAKIKRAATG
jgi:transcriptional regulator with XRE-family HTH domain